jgi:hypothetical protein
MMVTHLTPYDPAYQQWLGAVGAGLTPSSGPYQAQQQAYALMQAVLARQAAVKAFLYNWRWIGLGIALCGPLVLLMRKAVIRKTPGGPVAEL